MKKFVKRLGDKGFSHHFILPVVVVAIVCAVGVKILVSSHADQLNDLVYCTTKQQVYTANYAGSKVLNSQLTAPNCYTGAITLGNGGDNVYYSDFWSLLSASNVAPVSGSATSGSSATGSSTSGSLAAEVASAGSLTTYNSPSSVYNSTSGYGVQSVAYNEATNKLAVLIYSTQGPTYHDKLLLMNPNGTNVTNIGSYSTTSSSAGNPINIGNVQFSADGNNLAYSLFEYNPTSQITTQKLVIAHLNTNTKTIVYSSTGNSSTHPNLFTLDSLDAWTPDNATIVGLYDNNKVNSQNIASWSPSKGRLLLTTSTTGSISYNAPAVSPNGKQIAAIETVNGTNYVVILNTASNSVKRIFALPNKGTAYFNVGSINWSPDSTHLAVIDNYGVLRVMKSDGTGEVIVAGDATPGSVKVGTVEWTVQ